MGALRVATYNVHGCVGTDFRLDPARVARVIDTCRADVIALQEIDVGRKRSRGADQAGWIATHLGMGAHFFHALECDGGRYGNAVLSRHPMDVVRCVCLPQVEGREPRALQWIKIRAPELTLNVLNTHLGLDERERLTQAGAIVGKEWIALACAQGPTVLCGDFNAGPRSTTYRALTDRLRDAQVVPTQRARARGTFPSWLPLLRIDHVLVSVDLSVVSCRVVASALAKLASDHLPLVVELDVPGRVA